MIGLQLVCQMDGLDIGIPYSPSYYSDHCKHVGEMSRTRTRYTNATKKISCCFLFTYFFSGVLLLLFLLDILPSFYNTGIYVQ